MKTIQLFFLFAAFNLIGTIKGQDVTLNTSSGTGLPAATAMLSWENTTIDVGSIRQNEPFTVDFLFRNTGNQAIVVTDVRTSCGCTAAKHTSEPIQPGDSTKITVTYNAKNQGAFHKSITVTTTADENPVILTLSGTVK